MSRESVLSILGVLVLLSPFLGLPLAILSFILPLLGALTLGIALSLRRDRVRKASAIATSHETSSSMVP
ncbi:hypothetical protein KJ819_00595 [Patescibacteria group bacterium]|nr:hypothetical protein [Patescibacteria group bacterium]MBU1501135.1 hypothetical protein [Patescibacteria group bacterium]MBU2080992.1 hypothetical protein [Patescibacteria group bacterium]MBU2124084.1 hypothetical protein [Patescibacteria group bacterium]MBU2194939.1 hypothetical protein [Patescibacteria group bacterium]